ncbi:MAG TPA: metal ABC transporter permease [Candidatus Saccharicenans sp.]|jgi:zinc transport system permease protein|nr:metal ABC transporter permease [Candidatus Saccharicenans sp.]HRD01153.1 metal ABC transporter permease [Candidatus Saccharicenans sp.]
MVSSILTSGFFWRAVLAGSFLAVACGLLGVFLILRQDSMISHGLSHVAFAGIALGLVLNFLPLIVSLIICGIGSIFILKLKQQARLPGDAALAILSSAGMALAIFLVSLRMNFGVELMGYLFGDILAISPVEVWLSIALALMVTVLILINYHQLLYMTFDRETALVAGVRVSSLDKILVILTAITVVLGLRIVGLLLVSALTVIPAASALLLARSFRQTLVLSSIFSLVSIVAGIILAYLLDLPASASIVFLSIAIFLTTLGGKKVAAGH